LLPEGHAESPSVLAPLGYYLQMEEDDVMRKLIILVAFLATACTGTTTERIVVQPEANACQITEIRPTSFSTLTLGICWDHAGRPLGMVGAGGLPSASVPLSILRAGALVGGMVGGAAVLGSQVNGLAIEIPER